MDHPKCWIAAACIAFVAGCESAPWFDLEPDPDLGYLPLGGVAFSENTLMWSDGDREIEVDAYLPATPRAPVAVMLPGTRVIKERYRWLGATLASHGIATFVPQPPGAFATSRFSTETLEAVAARDDLDVDTSRVILAGHSSGGVPQAGLTDVTSCPLGFCDEGAYTPRGLRGLVLIGWHNQNEDDDDTPMPAVESPWLIVNGTRDGGATPEVTAVTVDRLQDRPVYSVGVVGANHFQMTDYVDPKADLLLPQDPEPTVGNREARAAAAEYIAAFARRVLLDDPSVPDDLGAGGDERVTLDLRPARLDPPGDHGLPRVLSEPIGDFAPGPGADDAIDVIATERYGDATYLLIRDDERGVAVWRLPDGGGVEAVPFPAGQTHGFYGNRQLNGMLGDLAVFDGQLWAGVSSGTQGASLASTGGELWAYDGQTWRPVISPLADDDLELTITACAGGAIAELTVAGAPLEPGAWAGATVDDATSPDAGDTPLVLYVVDNTADTLRVEINEIADQDEVYQCEGLSASHRVSLRAGIDEAGFGQPWNKAIVALEVFDGRLFVGTGFNYEHGAEVWATGDGITFELAVPRSVFGEHPDGQAITSSIAGMHASDVTGEDVLYVAGTGTEGYGARLLAYRAGGAVDFVFDQPGAAVSQIPSMVTWNDRLWMAVMSFGGMELWSMTPDGALHDHIEPGWGDATQLAARLFVIDGQLWAADVAFVQSRGELSDKSAYAWRTADGAAWQLVTAHAFGINAIKVSQLFRAEGALYAIASSAALSTKRSYGPLRAYTLEQE